MLHRVRAAAWYPSDSSPDRGTTNRPEVAVYAPCRAITVTGSNCDHASALPPYNRSMVFAFVPALGVSSPAMSTNALKISGYLTANVTAHVPPAEKPATPQADGSARTPKV